MIFNRKFSSAIFAIVVSALLAQSAFAQLNSPRLGSGIMLYVDGGAEQAILPVIAETAGSDLLTYDFASNEVRFSAGVLAASYNEPFFCFDMGAPASPVSIQVDDPNGHVVVDGFELSTTLEYAFASSSLLVNPTVNQQCFYESSQGVFGLFGQSNSGVAEPQDVISRDRFEPDLSMDLAFQNVPEFATPGQTIDYDLVLTNTGTGAFSDIALQELFPENLGVYAAALTGTQITCTPSGGATCPTIGTEAFLRFRNPSSGGVDLPAGASLSFNIQRTVDPSSQTGQDVLLHAGAVADPLLTGVPFAVDQATVTVIGESAGLDVATTQTTADSSATTMDTGDDSQITVTVYDANQNPVPFETVTLDNAGGLTITSSTSGTTDANGEVLFTGTAATATDYTVSFTSGTLTGNGSVTVLPGAPSAMVAAALDPEAFADGTDAPLMRVVVEDGFGNRTDAVEVTAQTIPDPGLLPALQASVFTNLDGEADFSPTSTTADVFQIEFAVAGVGTDTTSVEFLPGTPAALAFEQEPSSVVGDGTSAITPPVRVRVLDSNQNWVDIDGSTFVQLRLRQNGVTIDPDLASGTVVNGEIEFANLTFDPSLVGTGYTLRAVGTTSTDIFFVESGAFDITPAQ